MIKLILSILLLITPAWAADQTIGGHIVVGVTSTVSSAGTLTLTKASNSNQIITGATTHTVVLPNATTLVAGRAFTIWNASSGTVTVNYNGGALAQTVGASNQRVFLVRDTSTSAGTWNISTSGVDSTITIAQGGTGQTTQTAAFDALDPLTTLGDILYHNGTNSARLGIGSLGQELHIRAGAPVWERSSLLNYIANPGAEGNASTGWTTYDDGASSSPVDATGGSPSMVLDVSGTTPLRQSYKFQWNHSGADNQGEGVSYLWSIDRADRARAMSCSFPYELVSGTYNVGTSTTDPDLTVWAVPVDGSYTTPIKLGKLDGGVVAAPHNFYGEFQSTYDATQYRIAIHEALTGTSTFIVAFDDVKCEPIKSVNAGPTVGVEQDYTTTTGLTGGTTTFAAKYRQIGSMGEVWFEAKFSTIFTGGVATFTLPFTLDTTASRWGGVAPVANQTQIGKCHLVDVGSGVYPGMLLYSTATTAVCRPLADDVGTGSGYVSGVTVSTTDPFTWANNDIIGVHTDMLPVLGWENVGATPSNINSGRPVYLTVGKTSGSHTSSGSEQTVASWDTATLDSHSGFVASTGIWTAPEKDLYDIDVEVRFNADSTGSRYCGIAKNGTTITKGTPEVLGSASVGAALVTHELLSLVSGDTIRIVCYQNSGGSLAYAGAASATRLNISNKSGRSFIAASDSVNFSANLTTSTTGVADGTIVFNQVIRDSHGAYSAGTYTVQSPGYYCGEAKAYFTSLDGSTDANLQIRKNGTAIAQSFGSRPPSGTTTEASLQVARCYPFVAGDAVTVYADGDASFTIDNSGNRTTFDFYRVGN